MQNPIQKFGAKLYWFQETGYFVWKFENFDELQLPDSSIVFVETLHTFPTYRRLQKGVRDFLNFVYILSYLQKLNGPGFYTLVFYIFINNSRSKQNKKNPEHPFLDIIK